MAVRVFRRRRVISGIAVGAVLALVLVAVYRVRAIADDARAQKAGLDLKTIAYTARNFHRSHGHWPSRQELFDAMQVPRDQAAVGEPLVWRDLWGREYTFGPEAGNATFVARCSGPDGVAGNADDVVCEVTASR